MRGNPIRGAKGKSDTNYVFFFFVSAFCQGLSCLFLSVFFSNIHLEAKSYQGVQTKEVSNFFFLGGLDRARIEVIRYEANGVGPALLFLLSSFFVLCFPLSPSLTLFLPFVSVDMHLEDKAYSLEGGLTKDELVLLSLRRVSPRSVTPRR